MSYRRTILSLLVLVVFFITSGANDTQNPFRARYLSIFTKYIEWPENYKKGDFVVAFLGNDALVSAYTTKMTGKTVGTQNVKIIKYGSAKEVGKCHIPVSYTHLTLPTTSRV